MTRGPTAYRHRHRWPPWAPSSSAARGTGPEVHLPTGSPTRRPAVATLSVELGGGPGDQIPAPARGPPAAPVHPPGHRQWPPWALSSSAARGHLQHRITHPAAGSGHLECRARRRPGGPDPGTGPGATCSTGSPARPPAVATLGPELVGGPGPPAAPDHPPGHRHWPPVVPDHQPGGRQ